MILIWLILGLEGTWGKLYVAPTGYQSQGPFSIVCNCKKRVMLVANGKGFGLFEGKVHTFESDSKVVLMF